MAQTIPVPGGSAESVSEPSPGEQMFPGLEDALGLTRPEPALTFSGLDKIDLEMSDEEKSQDNPFLKLPKANTKGFAESMGEAWNIGKESVLLDRQMSQAALRVLATGREEDLSELDKKKKELSKKQYYNQGGNVFSRAFLGAAEMIGPMVEGTLEGIPEAGTYGSAGFAVGAGVGAAGMGIGAIPTSALFGTTAAGAGFLKGSFDYWTEQGRGMAFSEALDSGVNQQTAARVASVVAPLYAAVEYSQVQGLVKTAVGADIKKGILKGAIGKALDTYRKIPKTLRTIVEETSEEALQGAIVQTGTEFGKSEQALIADGAATGFKDTLANLDLGESAKEILSRAGNDFVSSIGPMAVLGGTAGAIRTAKSQVERGVRDIAGGELTKLSERRAKLESVGAPATAEAITAVNATPPRLEDQDPALEEDLEKSAKPEEPAPAAAEPVATISDETTQSELDLQNSLEAAKVWGNIRAKKPVAAEEVKRLGFVLSESWKLNDQTGNFEFQGVPNETQKGETLETSAVAPAAEPIVQTEATAPETTASAQAQQPAPAQQGEEAVASALKEKKTEELPAWEKVQENKNQIKFLQATLKKANAKVAKEQQIAPKDGWKRKDYLTSLEKLYGQISQLELPAPAPKVEAPKTEAPLAPSKAEKDAARRKARLASIIKVFGLPELNGEQQIFRDLAMDLLRPMARQVARRYANVSEAEGEIYNGTLAKVARQLKNAVEQRLPVLFNKKGEAIPVTRESVSKWMEFAADSAAKDAARKQEGRKEVGALFESAPPEGAVTQPEAAKDAAKATETQVVAPAKEEAKPEPKATQAIRSVAAEVRKGLSPEAKVVLDWAVSQIVGDKTDLGNIKTYKELATYLTTAAGRKVSDKKVGVTVNDVLGKLTAALNEENISVDTGSLEMAISPEGRAAREKLAQQEAEARQNREIRKAQMELADRARNLDVGYTIKERLVDLASQANAVNRGRLNAEVIKPAEDGLLEDAQINERLDNIEKGTPNEKPATGEPVSGSPAQVAGQTAEGQVLGRTGEGRQEQRGTADTEPAPQGKPADEPRGNQPERPRTGRAGRKVAEEQQGTTGSVSLDQRLEGKQPPAVRKFIQTVTSSGIPVRLVAETESPKPISVEVDSAETEQDPVIRINPTLLGRVAKTLGAEAYSSWSFLALTEEVVHFRYLKLLAQEAKDLGIGYKQHLKNETKRIASIIKRRRGLRQKLEKLYNNGEKFKNDFEMVFEFMRMIPQEKLTGSITEATYLDVESIIRAMEPQERRFVFRFIDAVRDFLYGITGRTSAETKFLRETADAIVRMSSRISRNLASPNEKLPVQMKYFEPAERKLVETKESREAAEKETKATTGLSNASLKFLKEYAKELGLKVPTAKKEMEVLENGKVVEKTLFFPTWKKADYIKAIKEKLKEVGEKQKEVPQELGAALPTDRPYWLKPNGQTVDVEETALIDLDSIGSHSQAAVDYLNENEENDPFLTEWKLLDPFDRKEQQGRVVLEMLRRGWLRVVGDGFNLYFEGTPSKEQLDKLFEAAVEDEVKLIQDLSGTTGRARSKTLYEPPLPDELGAAMPRHGFSTTRPRFILYDKALPNSLQGLKQVKVLGGTHDVRLYQDKMGNKFAVKFGQTEQQYQNELASDNIYRILNYPVPASKLIRTEDGELVKISAFVNGPTLGDFEREMKDSPEAIEEVNKSIANGLLIDAYLFNYDVLGQNKDNIVVAHEEYFDDSVIADGRGSIVSHVPYRIDNGGTLDTRAMGLERDEPFFYDTFKRLQARYPNLKLEPADIVAQLSDLVLNSDKILNSIPERLRPMMAKRLQWMADQLSALDTVPASGATQEEITRHFDKLTKEMADVEVTRNSQGELINKATGKPSRLYTISTSGKVLGFEPKSEFRYRLERTPSFKLWFGDWEANPDGRGTSKILDEAGEPWLLYHGTRASSRMFGQVFKTDAEMAGQPSAYPRKFAGNTFRGTWVSTSRAWAEDWAENTGPDHYDEQVVIPMYVKSTNPFDPNNPVHLDRLLNYLKEKRHDVDPVSEIAIREGYDDWTILETRFNRVLNKEGTDFVIPPASRSPNMDQLYKPGDTEKTRKRKFFSKMPYPALEAIINLGFDGMWTREKGMDESPLTERQPLLEADRLFEAARSGNKNEEAKARADLLGSINAYRARSIRTFLAFRNDGIKSAINTGVFRSLEDRNKLRSRQNSQVYTDRVSKNPVTKWNEFVKDGVTYASYEPAQNLVTYAFASPATLSENNIAKTKISDDLYYVGERLAPPPRSSKREEMDILGAAMPRQFGVRLKDRLHAEAYDRLKNLTYEPIPDAMVEKEAQDYLEKHGIRGAMEAALSKSSPLEYGSRELLAQIIMKRLEKEYVASKDPRVLEDLVDFTDSFLSISSELGRALRALSFLTRLSKEGMLVMYRKKADETNREVRDRFNEFFAKVKRELSALPEGTIDKVLKNMEGTLQKADKAAAESRKKLAVNNTMTFWESFADQLGKSLVQKAESQLAEAEAEAEAKNQGEAVAQEGEAENEAKKKTEEKIKNAKVINQAAQELSQNIRRMYLALAEEQGRRIRDPRVITDEEFANKTEAELEQIHKEERTARQIKKFTDMLAAWPKAKQAWQTAVDAIRTKTETNPDLAQMFNEFLDLSLESPFTMPQLRRLLSLKGIKVEDLIREHYQEGGLANNATSLARELVEKAGIGAWEEGIGSDYQDETGFYKFKKRSEDSGKEEPSEMERTGSLSQRLTNAIALQIQKYASDEATKKLDRLIKNFADKRLEPSLRRFAKRLVEYQALGLFNNSSAWNEFKRQEGLENVKPEVMEKLVQLVSEAEKLQGFRKDQKYADAISLIAYETQVNKWNWVKPWWYLSILSGFTTQLINLVGNASNHLLMVTPMLGKHLAMAAKEPARAKALTSQYMRAFKNALYDFAYILEYGVSGTRKSENPQFSRVAREYFELIAKNSPTMFGRAAGTGLAMVGRLMSAMDMLFYNLGKEAYLYEAAFIQAKNEGLEDKEATQKALSLLFRDSEKLAGLKAIAEEEGYVVDQKADKKTQVKQATEQLFRIQELADERVAGTEESKDLAIRGEIAGNELTFNEEPVGFLGMIHKQLSALMNKYGLVSFVVPFTRIVANVWNQGLDYTGFGFIRSKYFSKDLEGTAEEVETKKKMMRQRAKYGMTAVAIMALLDKLTCGNYETFGFELCINGPGPKEAAQRELLKNRLKWKPYSLFVRSKIGMEEGAYLSYLATPLAFNLGAIGTYNDNEIYRYFSKKDDFDAKLAIALRAGTMPFEMNFLSGLGDLFDILTPSNPESGLAKMKSFLGRLGSSMFVPNLARDIDQLSGLGGPRTSREGLMQAVFIANTPGARQYFGSTELDMLGRPAYMTSRLADIAKKDALTEVLIEKNALPSPAKKDRLLGSIPMNDEQFAKYRNERSRVLGEILDNPQTIQRIKEMDPLTAQMFISQITSAANQRAKAKLFRDDPAILEEARGAKLKPK